MVTMLPILIFAGLAEGQVCVLQEPSPPVSFLIKQTPEASSPKYIHMALAASGRLKYLDGHTVTDDDLTTLLSRNGGYSKKKTIEIRVDIVSRDDTTLEELRKLMERFRVSNRSPVPVIVTIYVGLEKQ